MLKSQNLTNFLQLREKEINEKLIMNPIIYFLILIISETFHVLGIGKKVGN